MLFQVCFLLFFLSKLFTSSNNLLCRDWIHQQFHMTSATFNSRKLHFKAHHVVRRKIYYRSSSFRNINFSLLSCLIRFFAAPKWNKGKKGSSAVRGNEKWRYHILLPPIRLQLNVPEMLRRRRLASSNNLIRLEKREREKLNWNEMEEDGKSLKRAFIT